MISHADKRKVCFITLNYAMLYETREVYSICWSTSVNGTAEKKRALSFFLSYNNGL